MLLDALGLVESKDPGGEMARSPRSWGRDILGILEVATVSVPSWVRRVQILTDLDRHSNIRSFEQNSEAIKIQISPPRNMEHTSFLFD